MIDVPEPTELELHINCSSTFTSQGWGRKVKAAGGRFAECRGYSSSFVRQVFLPNTERGRLLSNQILRSFPCGPNDKGQTAIHLRGLPSEYPQHAPYLLAPAPAASASMTVEVVLECHRDTYRNWLKEAPSTVVGFDPLKKLETNLKWALDRYAIEANVSAQDAVQQAWAIFNLIRSGGL